MDQIRKLAKELNWYVASVGTESEKELPGLIIGDVDYIQWVLGEDDKDHALWAQHDDLLN
jgi:hypothetical protein